MPAEVFLLGITRFFNIKSYSKEFRKKVPLDIIFCVLILIIVYLISRYTILMKRFLFQNLKFYLFSIGISFIWFSPISFLKMDPMLKPNSGTMLRNIQRLGIWIHDLWLFNICGCCFNFNVKIYVFPGLNAFVCVCYITTTTLLLLLLKKVGNARLGESD